MPWPMGTLPIVEPDHSSGRRVIPRDSPGKSIPVLRPNPNRSIHSVSPARCNCSASVTTPTLDDRDRICETVIVCVPRGTASWMTRSAIGSSYGSRNFVVGETMPDSSTPPTVTTLKVDPGS